MSSMDVPMFATMEIDQDWTEPSPWTANDELSMVNRAPWQDPWVTVGDPWRKWSKGGISSVGAVMKPKVIIKNKFSELESEEPEQQGKEEEQ